MKQRMRDFIHQERGAIGAIMAITLVVVIGFVALGIDVGYRHVKKGALQKAADIAALVGGKGLIEYGSDLEQIQTEVLAYGHNNLVADDAPNTALQPSDVTFYLDGTPNTDTPNQVDVNISRIDARNNALPTVFGRVLNVDTLNVTASSRVEVAPVCSTKCIKPFTVPDKFTFTDHDGDGELTPSNPLEMASVVVDGYSDSDFGTQITLKIGNPGSNIVPGQFNAIDLPPLNKATPVPGAASYRENIASCTGSNAAVAVGIGDEMQLEPGNMTGPTAQGIRDLIALDPGAYWDSANNNVSGSDYGSALASPRVALIAFYDPANPPQSGRNTVFVNYIGAVFIEGMSGNDVMGRFIRALAVDPGSGGGDDCLVYILKFVRDSSRL
ncbi:pilus assembly protein TadG-related protein [Desulfovibrio mangrovi]|uniref:TadE/TadG family type IV pilus assembly protein n=1 Tax=Desulfovibrio mangrovi TaxID=2976983 RepID=UPI002246400B|nr:TadE/TadG family type IV pilus assembly protein [Desulfovibrio mangrovi]UZP68795.1 pilus assembly protein TadG-related protein [Desulfovibrio mangrovi]